MTAQASLPPPLPPGLWADPRLGSVVSVTLHRGRLRRLGQTPADTALRLPNDRVALGGHGSPVGWGQAALVTPMQKQEELGLRTGVPHSRPPHRSGKRRSRVGAQRGQVGQVTSVEARF